MGAKVRPVSLWRRIREALRRDALGLAARVWPGLRRDQSNWTARRGVVTHVVVLDGTMSSLEPGQETNAGLAYRLLSEAAGAGSGAGAGDGAGDGQAAGAAPGKLSLYYEAGLQWRDWRSVPALVTGRGINRQIRRAYGYLASRYRPGDRIVLLGYSRGAYAVRSLAGLIDQVGLLRPEHATERQIAQAYRHYQAAPGGIGVEFARAYCHPETPVEMIGVWDTVKALGLRWPVVWRWMGTGHEFHNHHLGAAVKAGYHALARDETRLAYAPVLWQVPAGWEGRVEQVWFPGSHADVGGQVGDFPAARPLANIPLVWMLDKLEAHDVALPEGWRSRFPRDAGAEPMGCWRGLGKLFVMRRARVMGRDRSERLYEQRAPEQPRAPERGAAPAGKVAPGGTV